MNSSNSSRALYKAIRSSVAGRLMTYALQFLLLAIYARLFSPEQFGVIASLQVFVIFFQLFAEVGIGPALINEQEIDAKRRDGIFSFTLIMGLLISVCFFCFSFYLNVFYGRDDYQQYAVFISAAIIFQTISTLPLVSLQKEARFLKIARIDMLSELVSAAVVGGLYFYGFGLLALAAKPLAYSVSRFFQLHHSSRDTFLGRSAFGRELYHIKHITHFSLYQFGFNFVNYFSRNLDNILIGKYIGISSLGVYDKSYQLMKYPLQLITFAMAPAIQPVLSKHQADKPYIQAEHDKLAEKLLVIAIPIALFIYGGAYQIVSILFGAQWLGVVPVIEILSLIIPMQMVLSTSGAFFQSINKPKLLFVSGIMSAVCNIVAIVIGINIGTLEAVAFAICISFTINFFQAYAVLFYFGFETSPRSFLFMICCVCLKYLATTLIFCYLLQYLNFGAESFSGYVADVAIRGGVLLLLLVCFNRSLIVKCLVR